MIARLFKEDTIRLVTLVVCLAAIGAQSTVADQPTLHFDYGQGTPHDNSVGQFMYFVPLISPEPVSVYTNVGNTQCARVISLERRTNGAAFYATCKFEFTGTGSQQNIFDYSEKVQRRKKEIENGEPLKHQLKAINVSGTGSGSVEIEGTLSNGLPNINTVQLRFNRNGHSSPVTIDLHDLVYHDETIRSENEMQARVNSLTFRRTTEFPKMEVTLASIKPKDAGDGLWQNFVGGLKGATANFFLPPLKVEPEGQQAMIDFGLALATKKPDFTFPVAKRLKASSAIKQ